MSTFIYRVLLTSWGVWIKLEAHGQVGGEEGRRSVYVGSGVSLVDDTEGDGLSLIAVTMLRRGLLSISDEISKSVEGRPVSVVITNVQYNDCDFQNEGLSAAIVLWAVGEFGLPERSIEVTFDRAENRYSFDVP